MATLGAQVDSTGISAPSYADILQELRNAYWSIYGSDADLDNDSQDGQFLSVIAQGISDCNNAAIAVYNSRSPTSAVGAGLSSVVKINGIRRQVPTNSTVVVSIGGVVGTIINDGIVGDNLGLNTQWALPSVVTIPISGTIDVTATSTVSGAVAAGIGTITDIITPTLGWQSVSNAAQATQGNAVEPDAGLRERQSVSTANQAETILDAIYGNLANLTGVSRLAVYENDTDVTDGNGVPSHSISAVVQGGDAIAIATVIADKKAPGTGTYGSTSEVIIDSKGVPNTISFFPLTEDVIPVVVTIKALAGYASSTGQLAIQAVAHFISGLDIGEKSYTGRLYAPANLNGDSAIAVSGLTQPQLDVLAKTFNVTSITQNGGTADIAVAFNHAAACAYPANTVLVTT